MKISIDTKEDSHEEIKKVIRMLQNIVGESGEIFTNAASPAENGSITGETAFNNIFKEENKKEESIQSSPAPEQIQESTEDIFAELFNDKDLEKIKQSEEESEEEEEAFIAKKKSSHSIEFY